MARDKYEIGMKSLSRGSSLFGTDPQVQLRNALRNNELGAFRKLLNHEAVDPDYCYEYPDYKTCLDIACSDPGRQDFISVLLNSGVDVNKVNETHNCAPIHFAIQNGNIKALKILLDDQNINVNILSKGNTPLLLAIKKIDDIDDDREYFIKLYEEIVELLVKAGADVNIPDLKGCTAIYSASKQGLENIARLIIENAKDPIDLDTYKDRRQKTARMLLQESFPHLLEQVRTATADSGVIDSAKLFSHLSKHDEEGFIRDFNKAVRNNEHKALLTQHNGIYTMLQMAVEKNLEKVVEKLLSAGADPNLTAPGSGMRPIALACRNGYHKILKTLIEQEGTLFDTMNDESLLHIVSREMKNDVQNHGNYKECLDILLTHNKVQININYEDIKGNTALHYAARNGDHETILTLLRNGACVGLRNKFNEPALADIDPKTLETFLDECLETNEERPSDEDYEIHIKYSFLVYPKRTAENEASKVPLMDNSDATLSSNDSLLAPEVDSLLYMTQNRDLRPLLKHPVITSFLYLKWQRISCLFYANLTFYSLFWLCLLLYILLGYDGDLEKHQYDQIVQYVAIVGLLLLMIRELSQLIMSPRKYFGSLENWLEVALIIVASKILFDASAPEHTRQQLSAVAILLSSAELVLLIGQFPSLSTNIVMLKTVSWNFFKFILWYCILIIAFALSFYTLFRKEETVENNEKTAFNPNAQNEEEDENFFTDPGQSLFKTIVMLTGEFDAGSIKFGSFPVTSHIIFIVFVFMVPIVLFNLLNGLAVSDTQAIKANAELVGHIARVKLISYFEHIIFGDKQSIKHAVRSSQNVCCWLPGKTCISANFFCLKPLARRICLFPSFLPKHKIIVKPNLDCKILIPQNDPKGKGIVWNDDDDMENGFCLLRNCNNLKLDRNIVKDARTAISEKSYVSELSLIQDRLITYEKKMNDLDSTLKEILATLKTKYN